MACLGVQHLHCQSKCDALCDAEETINRFVKTLTEAYGRGAMSLYRCPHCTELVVIPGGPVRACPECGATLIVQPPTTEPSTPPASIAPGEPTTFAMEGSVGSAWSRGWQTILQLGRRAPLYFSQLQSVPDTQAAERFAYFCCVVGFLAYFGVEWWGLQGDATAVANALSQMTQMPPPDPERILSLFKYGTLFSPIFALLPVHLSAGLYQAGLWSVGVQNRGFDITFKVAGYGFAPMLLCVIPGIGWLFAPAWVLSLHWVGIASAHRISLFRAALATVLPWFVFMMLVGGIIGKALLFWLYHGDLPTVGM